MVIRNRTPNPYKACNSKPLRFFHIISFSNEVTYSRQTENEYSAQLKKGEDLKEEQKVATKGQTPKKSKVSEKINVKTKRRI